jgi:hypothetical protein
MDSIVSIAVRFGTGVLFYDNNIIHIDTYSTPVPDLSGMIKIESILRHTILQCQT